MPNFMLLATSWGPKHGGINAFNMDLAVGLANYLGESGKVFCAAFSPSAEDFADARRKQINLVGINRPVDSGAYDPSWAHDVWTIFKKDYPDQKIDWWVGHDVTTGWAAVEGPVVAESGQSALIMHMNYADYQNYKSGIGQHTHQKVTAQRKLFPKGNCHFANGPLLRDALRDIVGPNVTMLVPGFADVPTKPSLHRLHLITFGRMDRESQRIKQGGLAVAGFASAVKQAYSIPVLPEKLRDNPQMRIIGIKEPDGDEERSLARLASEKAGREINLIALPFDEDRANLFEELGRANIALMLSWHEGFGLTGWEAVAGGVPLIVSRQTGLWQLLKETLGEPLAGGYVRTIDVRGQRGDDESANFLPEDEIEVRDAIVSCAAKLSMAQTYAAKLKQELKKELICTWDNTAKVLCDGLRLRPIASAIDASPAPLQPTILPILRSDFITIPKPNWPGDFSHKGFEMPDAMLLRPESRIVRFHHLREPLRDTIIEWALNDDAPIKVRLQAGEGGAGKTRLLIEVCYQLEYLHGWRAGFVDRSKSIVEGFPELLRENRPSFLVLDYAESRTTEIASLIKTALHFNNPPLVRLLLLAREGGDWWNRLADGAGVNQAVAAILRGLKTKTGPYRMSKDEIAFDDRLSLFDQALEDFAAFKKIPKPLNNIPDLSSDLFRNPLFIHLAALATLRGYENLNDKELLGLAIGHERSYWHKLLNELGLSEQLFPGLEQGVALLTLCGGRRTAKEAKTVLTRTPRLRELDSSTRTGLFDCLRMLYPHPFEGGLIGLQPDLLGEALVAEALNKDDELLDVVLGEEADRADVRHALTVLTRLGRRDPRETKWLKQGLERNLTRISEDALQVGIETGSPLPEIHAEVIAQAGSHERRLTTNLLRPKLPEETVNLASLSLEVNRQAIAFMEKKASGKSSKRFVKLIQLSLAISNTLSNEGKMLEAADAATQAVNHAQIVFRSNNEDDQERLAITLRVASERLRGINRFNESLPMAEQAEIIFSKLAKIDAEKLSSWAHAIDVLASSLDAIGRKEEALQKRRQAEEIQRDLAKKNPQIYNRNWGVSLQNLGKALNEVGLFNDALQKAQDGEAILRSIAEKDPENLDTWASSLLSVASSLAEVGRYDEALQTGKRAETIYYDLAEKRPDTYTPGWARSLELCSTLLGRLGRFEEALEKIELAERIRKRLAEIQPDAYMDDWASSLSNLAVSLRDVGRSEEAFQRAEQSEFIRRKLAEKQISAYTFQWTISLANLADAQLFAGKPADALETAKKAILHISPSSQEYFVIYGPWLGFAVRIVADSYFEMNRFDEAVLEAERATQIWSEIASRSRGFDTTQVARSYRILMRCEIALGETDAVIASLVDALRLLRDPLLENPIPLRPLMRMLVDLARSVDKDAVSRVVPNELLALIENCDRHGLHDNGSTEP